MGEHGLLLVDGEVICVSLVMSLDDRSGKLARPTTGAFLPAGDELVIGCDCTGKTPTMGSIEVDLWY
jgi:hypothetical protein